MTDAYRFGVSEFTTWPWSFEEDVTNYIALGVDAIEICEFKLDATRAEEQIAHAISAGLEISSVQPRLHSLFPDQPRPEPQEPAERMTLFRETIRRFGKAAPGTTLVTITGAAPGGNYREAFATAAREYRLLADFAADHGVQIAVEPLNPILMNVDTFISTIPDALRIVDAVDCPNFGVFLDVWHLWQDPAVIERIRSCGDRIFGVHVNDWHTPRCFGDRTIIGQGEIVLSPLIQAIRGTGYRGAYTLEIFSDESLPDSLWRTDLRELIAANQRGFDAVWSMGNGTKR